MTKWSVITNIHWKFEGFWAGSFGATKVYYLPFRDKNGRKNALSKNQSMKCWNFVNPVRKPSRADFKPPGSWWLSYNKDVDSYIDSFVDDFAKSPDRFVCLTKTHLIRKIRSHSFSVFNSRDNSQKIRNQPGQIKNCQQFSFSSIIILAVHVFFSFVWKIEINYWFNLWSWTVYESKVDNLIL